VYKRQIQYLSVTEDLFKGRPIYKYEDETYEIDDDYIIEFLDDEMQAGFIEADDGWIKQARGDSDDDYEPSDEEEATSSDDDDPDEDEEEYLDEEDYIDDD
jgi:hypothetical protein